MLCRPQHCILPVNGMRRISTRPIPSFTWVGAVTGSSAAYDFLNAFRARYSAWEAAASEMCSRDAISAWVSPSPYFHSIRCLCLGVSEQSAA